MLQAFRNFFKSRIGIVVTLAFLGLIALAFASMDVSNTATFGGVTGGDRVAVVGDRRIDTSELVMNTNNALERERQQNPTLTMEGFLSAGGLDIVLDQVTTRAALAEFGRQIGLRAGDRLVDSEIVGIPAFMGADGKFNRDTFLAALRQQGLDEATVRQDLAMSLYANQLITPVGIGARMPESAARRYASLRREEREGRIGVVPAQLFAPQGDPSDEQLNKYYSENRSDFIRPERRVLRYAAFGADAVADLPAPTEAQIAERYQETADQYAARESRTFTQLVVQSQAQAQQIAASVRGGASLASAAQAGGLQTTQVGPVEQAELASQASAAVARAAFAADRGAIATPAQGGLGWYVLRVDQVEAIAARPLAQVREEISGQLAAEQRRTALNDLTARIDEEFGSGRSLAEIARELKLEVVTTEPLTAAGQVYGTQQAAPQELGRILPVAFEMEEGSGQIDEIVPGQLFLVYDVARITPSAAAPLSEIRNDVIASWRRDTGMAAAGQAATRILGLVREGKSLAEAFAAEKVSLPSPRPLDMSRSQLEQSPQVPGVLALFFSMAEGTAKRLEEPSEALWYVVELDDIVAPELAADDPLIEASRGQLATLLRDEYTEQFVEAVKADVGVERNQAAIDAVRAQLTGTAN